VIAGIALGLIGGSEAVQAATRDYWQIRALATPFAMANYVILGWLIGLGRAGLGLALQIALNGVNVVLSVVLVHGLGLGVAGVGWASFAAEAVTAVAGMIVALRLMDVRHRPRLTRIFDAAALRKMVAVNRDIMIRSLALLLVTGFFVARSAASGDVILAANQILMQLYFVGTFFLDGMATAAEQYAGRAIGARYRPAFVRSLKLTIGWGFAIGAVLSAMLWLGGPLIIDAMTTNAAVRAAAKAYLPWAALTPLVGALAFQMDGVFIGATWSADMRNMMLASVLLYIAAWWLLSPVLGVTGLWIAFVVFLGVRGATLLWRVGARVETAFSKPD
jgi:MATE family multidrug resistance protein